MSYASQNTLNGCITSLSTSVSLLGDALSSLDTHADDFDRLGLILDQNRIFTLVPEHDLSTAKRSLEHEIEPRILKLVDTVKARLTKLERRRDALVSKERLNQVRINNFRSGDNTASANEDVDIEGTDEELEHLRQLRLKKDRLKYKLSSINLQNRKARLSMVNR